MNQTRATIWTALASTLVAVGVGTLTALAIASRQGADLSQWAFIGAIAAAALGGVIFLVLVGTGDARLVLGRLPGWWKANLASLKRAVVRRWSPAAKPGPSVDPPSRDAHSPHYPSKVGVTFSGLATAEDPIYGDGTIVGIRFSLYSPRGFSDAQLRCLVAHPGEGTLRKSIAVFPWPDLLVQGNLDARRALVAYPEGFPAGSPVVVPGSYRVIWQTSSTAFGATPLIDYVADIPSDWWQTLETLKDRRDSSDEG